ncbi:MAG: hypothetical protein ABR564_08035 [Candidatus Dormibacteria bacterium]
MTGELIMVLVALGLLAAFIVFYRYSRTPAWETSETRQALLNVIVAVGPLLGMHYKPPRPPLPGIMTPGPESADEDPFPGPEAELRSPPETPHGVDRPGQGGDRQ